MDTPRLFRTVDLSDGIKIYCYDKSRHVAGDRWYVCLRIEVPVEVKREFFDGQHFPEEAYREFTECFGNTYIFSYEKERNFIAENEVKPLLEGLLKDFLDNSGSYMRHPSWPKMCILKAYREWREKNLLKKLHEEVIRKVDENN